MSQAIDALRHEHDAILSTLQILRRMAARARQGSADSDDIAALLGFLQEFVDKCHHGKEEGLLFPALQRAGQQRGLVGELTAEHEQGRALVAALRQASTPVLDAEAFDAAARTYAEFLERHIDKENDVLFPQAEQALPADELEGLGQAFADFELQAIGPGRHEELHDLLHRWKADYAA
ncbi:hemerythrin domain-containing protein [Azotobacter salinestris]|uniref:hemerythrin domain-containing protein n=1 Tax=Azotobacter salinestris TaxID=69964 RepID=UPI00142EC9BF|nr:hemerythrin domain-containing protein [Azotobacter salinestris]